MFHDKISFLFFDLFFHSLRFHPSSPLLSLYLLLSPSRLLHLLSLLSPPLSPPQACIISRHPSAPPRTARHPARPRSRAPLFVRKDRGKGLSACKAGPGLLRSGGGCSAEIFRRHERTVRGVSATSAVPTRHARALTCALECVDALERLALWMEWGCFCVVWRAASVA